MTYYRAHMLTMIYEISPTIVHKCLQTSQNSKQIDSKLDHQGANETSKVMINDIQRKLATKLSTIAHDHKRQHGHINMKINNRKLTKIFVPVS